MNYQNVVISVVECLFPGNTKRRAAINIFGRPLAKALGFPIPEPEKISFKHLSDYSELIETASSINPKGENIYWHSIVNFLKIKISLFLSDPESRMTFICFDEPVVTIILITFNKAEYTFQCLETIKANTDIPYEVIIVDNASSDHTSLLLGKLVNVTVIKNEDNAGFVKACNQGAQKAGGKYLIFLNNDTQPAAGWLSSLVKTMEDYPECGAVGSKLVMPDGRLQEAGSILWNDGSTYGYGRESNPTSPEYNYLKEVDYCSGACLLTSRELFFELERFDERYAPAYYEELDLCCKIKKAGYKIIYQPESVVIHYEFGSSSSVNARNISQTNKKKFVEKWSESLKDYSPFSDKNILKARDKRTGARLLVIDDRVPAPYLGSGFPRTYELLIYLAELGYIVTFMPVLECEPLQPYTKYLQQMGVEVFYNSTAIDFNDFIEKRNEYYDAIFISRPHNMSTTIDAIKKHSPESSIIYDAEAIFALREILKSRIDGRELSEEKQQALIAQELELFKKADLLVAVSEYEKKVFMEYGFPDVKVWGHPASLKPTMSEFDDRKDLLFVGSFLDHGAPNEDAILYFVKEIFPEIHRKLACKLWVVGTNYLDTIKGLESSTVRVTGRVDDLTEYFEKCRLFIVPHRFAAGIPLKLIEAMGYGLPAVVSPLMAKQLDLTDGKEVLVGDSSTDFVDKVSLLYSDKQLWTNLRETSLNYVSKTFDPVSMKNDIDKTIKDALA